MASAHLEEIKLFSLNVPVIRETALVVALASYMLCLIGIIALLLPIGIAQSMTSSKSVEGEDDNSLVI